MLSLHSTDTGESKTGLRSEEKRSRKRNGHILLVLFIAAVCAAAYFAYCCFGRQAEAPRDIDITPYAGILTGREREQWLNTAVQEGSAFVYLNSRVRVTDGTDAEIRLINPPYSGFSLEAEYILTEDSRTVFSSGPTPPGTVIERASLNESLPEGEHPATVHYSFFDDDGTLHGEYQIDIVFVV